MNDPNDGPHWTRHSPPGEPVFYVYHEAGSSREAARHACETAARNTAEAEAMTWYCPGGACDPAGGILMCSDPGGAPLPGRRCRQREESPDRAS